MTRVNAQQTIRRTPQAPERAPRTITCDGDRDHRSSASCSQWRSWSRSCFAMSGTRIAVRPPSLVGSNSNQTSAPTSEPTHRIPAARSPTANTQSPPSAARVREVTPALTGEQRAVTLRCADSRSSAIWCRAARWSSGGSSAPEPPMRSRADGSFRAYCDTREELFRSCRFSPTGPFRYCRL
jgi:hypothetical protein